MAMVVISLDTGSRQCTLTIDGALVSADQVMFHKGTHYNGDPMLMFRYETQISDNNGLMQSIEYELPQPDMNMEGCVIEKNGLASKIIDKSKKLMKDIANFIGK
jgi:hypothetical protein